MAESCPKIRHGVLLAALTLLCALVFGAPDSTAESTERVVFVGVRLDYTRAADDKLQAYLTDEARVLSTREDLEYEEIIPRLAEWDESRDGFVVARTTPYVFVAAEMLGADLEVLATYESKATGEMTYRSHYVVRKNELGETPTPESVISWIRSHDPRVRFAYHSKFSTSSFFLPSLHFRDNQVFNTADATAPMAGIQAVQADTNSSKELVRAVARKDADLAAVWSGTRAHFLNAEEGTADAAFARDVEFIALPYDLPNDLLVCSKSAPAELKNEILKSIRKMKVEDMSVDDFSVWKEFSGTSKARQALSGLRQMAQPHQVPVIVEVLPGSGSEEGTTMMVEAARNAIRLSDSELFEHDGAFHKSRDMTWTLDEIHDGAARLTTTFTGKAGRAIDAQVFPISFLRGSPVDLSRRIVDIIRTQLHRIRYVWPYSENPPVVLRDNMLRMPSGGRVKVQRITWGDPWRNDFVGGPIWDVRVRHANQFVHELDFSGTAAKQDDLDPLSNISYRVYQQRAPSDDNWFRIATAALVILLVLAAISATFALRRQRRSAAQGLRGEDAP